MRRLAALLLLATALPAEPGRHLGYAESADRRVYAFVFGHKDTCRVIRRPGPPRFALRDYQMRPRGAEWRGEAGETVVHEFDFGRQGRPVHLVPSNDGRFLLAFSNRAPDGTPPGQDRFVDLTKKEFQPARLDYAGLPREPEPPRPEHPRAMPVAVRPDRKGVPQPALVYAFLAHEEAPGRVLIARRSETEGKDVSEIVCFVVTAPDAKVALPAPAELEVLLRHPEPLFRAGAAWAMGRIGEREALPHLKSALAQATDGVERATIALASVRCGEKAVRRTLRAVLANDPSASARREAARALAVLAPDPAEADLLAEATADADPRTADYAARALARQPAEGVRAALKISRLSRPASRAASARALGLFDAEEAEQRLLALVRDPDPSVQLAAAIALTRPPRRILPENHEELADALDGCRRLKNRRAASRLAKLAAQGRIRAEAVLKSLVEMADFHPQAIRSLRTLTGEKLDSPADCRKWWKDH